MASFHLSHLVVWLELALAASLLYFAGVVVYRLFFHPLARHPGPVLARVTSLHQLYHAWKGDRHLEFWRMHEKYGPVVRFAPNSVSICSAPALKDIYGFRSNVRKAEFYDAFVHPAPNTHNTRDKDVHGRKRRVLSQAFGDGAMREMETYILGNVRMFCDQLGAESPAADDAKMVAPPAEGKGWTAGRNMSHWCNYLAMDILGDLCFGKAFHMLSSPANRYALDLVAAATKRHLVCGTLPLIDRLRLDALLFPGIAKGRARYMAYSRAQLVERTRLGDDADRRDFFYHLLKARDPETGQGFSTPELWGESNLLIIAGSDTTSTALAATFFYLTRSARALSLATSEVRGAFGTLEAIRQGPELMQGCAYLRACVDEAMRMSPSVGGLLPREVLRGGFTVTVEQQQQGAGRGMERRQVHLPEGTVVGTPHYAVMHDPRYYPDPWRFAPERWIVGAAKTYGGGSFAGGAGGQEKQPPHAAAAAVVTEADVALAQSAFCPFSVGPRGCIGKGLAYAEMLTTLARVLYLYDLRRGNGAGGGGAQLGEGGQEDGAEWGRHRPEEFQLIDTFTSMKDGPVVQFRRRDGVVVE